MLKSAERKYSWKRILYMVCFFWLCLIDQRTKTGTGFDGSIETFQDSLGIVMAVIIMSHYKWSEFVKYKVPYLIWSIVSVVGGIAAFLWGMGTRPFLNEWVTIILDVILWGYIALHLCIDFFVEKKRPKLQKGFAVLWLVMLVAMLLSRSHYIWPLFYLLMFGGYYLTEFTGDEKKDLFLGCLDGFLLAFIGFQGFCCVFRPYDEVRYMGIYHNPNMNALLYLELLAAAFLRIIYLTKEKANKWLLRFYWLVAGAVMGFVFMTIGRIAWITAFVLGLLFLGFLNAVLQKKHAVGMFIKNGCVLVACTVCMFFICFSLTRYLPPVFHHPIWFWGEWAESKVHSWDEWDSEKYIDLDELMTGAFGRITDSIKNVMEHSGAGSEAVPEAPVAEVVPEVPEVEPVTETPAVEVVEEAVPEASVAEEMATAPVAEQIAPEVPAEEIVVVEPVDEPAPIEEVVPEEPAPRPDAVLDYDRYATDSFMIRSTIYKHYIANLNMLGHPYEEQGFQLFWNYWIGHAHNIFLQYGTDFGIPVMILFAVLVVWSLIRNWRLARAKKSLENMAALFFVLIPCLFGMMEYAWGVSSLSITMLFLAWRTMIVKEEE